MGWIDAKNTTRAWGCAALRQGTAGGNDPVDCGWPTCGCDPYAAEVIEALQESGALATRPTLTVVK